MEHFSKELELGLLQSIKTVVIHLKNVQIRVSKMYTHQALTAAYKDTVIRFVFFEGLKTLWSSRDLFNLFDNDIF